MDDAKACIIAGASFHLLGGIQTPPTAVEWQPSAEMLQNQEESMVESTYLYYSRCHHGPAPRFNEM